jgi:hypothetical protein
METDRFPIQSSKEADEIDFEESDESAKEKDRFRVGRDGDHWVCPFQCDLCHFQNVQQRSPGVDARDEFFLLCIRRANLDALWAREPSTIEANRRQAKHVRRAAVTFGVDHQWDRVSGPYPVEDTWGMFEATSILLRSLDPGRTSEFIQHDTMRKLRSHYSNRYKAETNMALALLSDDVGATFLTDEPRFGLWSKRFSQGVHSRMGDNPQPNRALAVDEMVAIQTLLEEDWATCSGRRDMRAQRVVATNAVVYLSGFVGSLRGEEIMKADLLATAKHFPTSMNHPRLPHGTLALRGRVKGETADRCHLLPLAATTKSGLEVGRWIGRLISVLESMGIVKGPLIQTLKGKRWVRGKIVDLDPMFHGYLRQVQKRWPELIPADHDPVKLSSIFRSLRRGSIARARNVKIPQSVIESNARWRKTERARGRRLVAGMMEHYSDVKAMLETLLQYSLGI